MSKFVIPDTEADDTPHNHKQKNTTHSSSGHRASSPGYGGNHHAAQNPSTSRQTDSYTPHQSELMRLCGESERTAISKSRKKAGQVFIVGKSGASGTKRIVQSSSGPVRRYITPDMDTPLFRIKEIPKTILESLKKAEINDVGDLCMIRRNGLSRHHILSESDIAILCDVMESMNIYL